MRLILNRQAKHKLGSVLTAVIHLKLLLRKNSKTDDYKYRYYGGFIYTAWISSGHPLFNIRFSKTAIREEAERLSSRH